jgi:hypothetical protein
MPTAKTLCNLQGYLWYTYSTLTHQMYSTLKSLQHTTTVCMCISTGVPRVRQAVPLAHEATNCLLLRLPTTTAVGYLPKWSLFSLQYPKEPQADGKSKCALESCKIPPQGAPRSATQHHWHITLHAHDITPLSNHTRHGYSTSLLWQSSCGVGTRG